MKTLLIGNDDPDLRLLLQQPWKIRHIPLILLTALEPPVAGDGAPEVFAYPVKPFSSLRLLETVR